MQKNKSLILLLVLLVSGWGCNKQRQAEAKKTSIPEMSEAEKAQGQARDELLRFVALFQTNELEGKELNTIEIGKLQVESGQLLVADPFRSGLPDTYPLARTIPTGQYLGSIQTCLIEGWGERVVYALLSLTDTPPASWEPALTTQPGPPKHHVVVKGGLAAFCDQQTAKRLGQICSEILPNKPDFNYYTERMQNDFAGHELWAEHHPDPGQPANILVFTSGLGDGNYPVYWGLDPNGRPVCLAICFLMALPNQHDTGI